VGVEKEGGHKEDCIHKSLSLGIVRYQGTEKKEERCVLCKSKEEGKEKGGKEGIPNMRVSIQSHANTRRDVRQLKR
jgi:hypothetical protein